MSREISSNPKKPWGQRGLLLIPDFESSCSNCSTDWASISLCDAFYSENKKREIYKSITLTDKRFHRLKETQRGFASQKPPSYRKLCIISIQNHPYQCMGEKTVFLLLSFSWLRTRLKERGSLRKGFAWQSSALAWYITISIDHISVRLKPKNLNKPTSIKNWHGLVSFFIHMHLLVRRHFHLSCQWSEVLGLTCRES